MKKLLTLLALLYSISSIAQKFTLEQLTYIASKDFQTTNNYLMVYGWKFQKIETDAIGLEKHCFVFNDYDGNPAAYFNKTIKYVEYQMSITDIYQNIRLDAKKLLFKPTVIDQVEYGSIKNNYESSQWYLYTMMVANPEYYGPLYLITLGR